MKKTVSCLGTSSSFLVHCNNLSGQSSFGIFQHIAQFNELIKDGRIVQIFGTLNFFWHYQSGESWLLMKMVF